MDLSSLLGTVLSADSISNMSQASNVSTAEVQNVLGAALPSLLGGALEQAENSDTAEGFANALNQHSASDLTDLSSFLGQVDKEDGAKIVGHLLGSQSNDVVEDVSRKAGTNAASTATILAIAAPLLMSLLGKENNSQQQSNPSPVSSIMNSLIGNADMGSILSGLLGGGAAPAAAAPASNEKEPTGLLGLLGKLLK